MFDKIVIKKREDRFDPEVDIRAVNQSGVLDLCACYVHGTIPGDIFVEDDSFNRCQSPETLMHRPKDWFEAQRQYRYVKESLRVAKANAEASQPEGAVTN